MKWKLIAAVMVVGGIAGWVISSPYSDGFRVGTIVKFSHKGWICKTWEAEVALGTSPFVGSGSYQTWAFSVRDPEVVKQIEDAQTSGKPVKLHYSQYRFRMPAGYSPCRMDSEYVVAGVERVQ